MRALAAAREQFASRSASTANKQRKLPGFPRVRSHASTPACLFHRQVVSPYCREKHPVHCKFTVHWCKPPSTPGPGANHALVEGEDRAKSGTSGTCMSDNVRVCQLCKCNDSADLAELLQAKPNISRLIFAFAFDSSVLKGGVQLARARAGGRPRGVGTPRPGSHRLQSGPGPIPVYHVPKNGGNPRHTENWVAEFSLDGRIWAATGVNSGDAGWE